MCRIISLPIFSIVSIILILVLPLSSCGNINTQPVREDNELFFTMNVMSSTNIYDSGGDLLKTIPYITDDGVHGKEDVIVCHSDSGFTRKSRVYSFKTGGFITDYFTYEYHYLPYYLGYYNFDRIAPIALNKVFVIRGEEDAYDVYSNTGEFLETVSPEQYGEDYTAYLYKKYDPDYYELNFQTGHHFEVVQGEYGGTNPTGCQLFSYYLNDFVDLGISVRDRFHSLNGSPKDIGYTAVAFLDADAPSKQFSIILDEFGNVIGRYDGVVSYFFSRDLVYTELNYHEAGILDLKTGDWVIEPTVTRYLDDLNVYVKTFYYLSRDYLYFKRGNYQGITDLYGNRIVKTIQADDI